MLPTVLPKRLLIRGQGEWESAMDACYDTLAEAPSEDSVPQFSLMRSKSSVADSYVGSRTDWVDFGEINMQVCQGCLNSHVKPVNKTLVDIITTNINADVSVRQLGIALGHMDSDGSRGVDCSCCNRGAGVDTRQKRDEDHRVVHVVGCACFLASIKQWYESVV